MSFHSICVKMNMGSGFPRSETIFLRKFEFSADFSIQLIQFFGCMIVMLQKWCFLEKHKLVSGGGSEAEHWVENSGVH